VDGPRVVGITAIGRATVGVLEMNKADRLLVRTALLREEE
jgi:hypothetical protein